MSKLLAIVVALFAAAWFATPALATPESVYVEICKASTGTPALTGSFQFQVTGRTAPIVVQVGTCSDPIQIPYGTGKVTVVEKAINNPSSDPWWMIASANYMNDGVTTALTPPAYTDFQDGYALTDIPLTQDPRESRMTVIRVTNTAVMGLMQVCKNVAQAGQVFPAPFKFDLTSDTSDNVLKNGWMQNIAIASIGTPLTVNAGSCSAPTPVPAGETIVTEEGTNGQLPYVTGIAVTPSARMHDSLDLNKGTVKVLVPATSLAKGETKVDFTNSLATLKVCKEVGVTAPATVAGYSAADALKLGPFSFTVNGGAAFTLQPVVPTDGTDPGVCHEVGQYVAGSQVTVAEAPVVGTAIADIRLSDVTQPTFAANEPVSMANGTATFFMRPGVNELTYVNDPAASVPVKVCKLPATLPGSYSFATTGLTGYVDPFWALKPKTDGTVAPTSFTVMPGQCTWVGYFPYHGTLMITEASGILKSVTIDPVSNTGVITAQSGLGVSVLLGNYATWSITAGLLYPAIVDFTNDPGGTTDINPNTNTNTNPNPNTNTNPNPNTQLTVDQQQGAAIASAAPPTQVAAVAKAMKVSSAKIVTVGKTRYVVVRVNGTAKTARIHVTLIQKNHKVVGSVTRYVATNKAVRVGNLKLAPSIVSVKVAL